MAECNATSATSEMTGRERVATSLAHREPDRVPLDIGATNATGIHLHAYRALRRAVEGTDPTEVDVPLLNPISGCVIPEEPILRALNVDVRGYIPRSRSGTVHSDDAGKYVIDELGAQWVSAAGELYFDQRTGCHPLAEWPAEADVAQYPWPEGGGCLSPEELGGWLDARPGDCATAIGDPVGGILFAGIRLRGFAQFMVDLLRNPKLACGLMDRVTEIRIQYWDAVFEIAGGRIDVVVLEEDLGGQDRLLVSPDTYRRLIKPRHKRLLTHIRDRRGPSTRIMFHSDGAIFELIPDLIELGVDVLNPIQTSATGMDPRRLKQRFGKELAFWGGGVDVQSTLVRGTVDDVRAEVCDRVESLAPGGGFVFSATQNMQPDVSPRNIEAMVEALLRCGSYA
jgi:uroporphyrinogen decarboxylase